MTQIKRIDLRELMEAKRMERFPKTDSLAFFREVGSVAQYVISVAVEHSWKNA